MKERHEVEGALRISLGVTYLEFNFFTDDFGHAHPTVFYRVIREALMPLCPTLDMAIVYSSAGNVGTVKCTIAQPCVDTRGMRQWGRLRPFPFLRSGIWLVKDDALRVEVRNPSFFKRSYRAPSLVNSIAMFIDRLRR